MRKTRGRKHTILLGVCAGIAAYRACDLINRLRESGMDVVVCMSKDAHHFITPLTLKTLSANRVFTEMFDPAQGHDPVHIELASRADLVLIMPATADIIAKAAHGHCDELLTCTIASTSAPVLFAPAMNNVMYGNKILQANISVLKQFKYHFIGPITGRLACGTKGIGHIADTADILRKAKTLLR
jgi:phosphopantothenoylcysteine decarboxylase / phosphopantothenate---cysteine ligase